MDDETPCPTEAQVRLTALEYAMERAKQTNASYNAAGITAEAQVFYNFLKGELPNEQ